MPVLLDRIFRRAEADPVAGPIPFGPRYLFMGDRLAIESGPLAGATLRVERSVSDIQADFNLFEVSHSGSPVVSRQSQGASDPVAHCHFDRDPETGFETLWGVFIRPEYRHRRLATVLIRLAFRELLAEGRRHWFAIRKLMQVDSESTRRRSLTPANSIREVRSPRSTRISLHNLGVGLVAVRLGFRPEPDLERLLGPGNVKAIQALPAEPPSPPGLLLRLATLPGMLVAALLDPDTSRPLADPAAYERFISPRQLLRQALAGEAIVGNIDYILPRAGGVPLAARLANDEAELRHFTAALRRGARN